MAKYKRYDYDQMVMLPISLENQLAVPPENSYMLKSLTFPFLPGKLVWC
jgi:hypothetical protein